MEGDADGPENATETDTLVNNESEISEDPFGKAQETSTLLSEMSEQNVGEVDETDSKRQFDPKTQPHPYHMRNKYTFRSDSVYSDVIPMSASQHSHQRTSETRDKSGSLSSLKAKESKWTTLKKKLGKLNSHSHSHSHSSSTEKHDEKDKETPQANKSLHEKRSLFQRAKTLSILPVHRTSSKDKEESHPKKVVVQEKPLELFNVGGEMNMIPLELLIDVNDLNMHN